MNSYKTDILLHSGIKGMHWGIRKYRNYDGSLTPAGKLRYGANVEGRGASAHTTVNERKAIRQANRQGPKDIGENRDPEVQDRTETIRLSNQELAARIERMKLEREYSALVNPPPAKRQSLLSKLNNVSKDLKGIIEMGSSVAKLYTDVSKAMEQGEKRKSGKDDKKDSSDSSEKEDTGKKNSDSKAKSEPKAKESKSEDSTEAKRSSVVDTFLNRDLTGVGGRTASYYTENRRAQNDYYSRTPSSIVDTSFGSWYGPGKNKKKTYKNNH